MPDNNENLLNDSLRRGARAIGTETEYGVFDLNNPKSNPVALSAEIIASLAKISRRTVVRWDYECEDPLNDMRGHRLERASAHRSMLTDNPLEFATSGYANVSRQSLDRSISPANTSLVWPNGGRCYVDHAHPEYSSPETLDARQAALFDRAGEIIAAKSLQALAQEGRENLVLYKNNTDSKGAAYGTHENYQIPREINFQALVPILSAFLITRPVLCGNGRVGLGQHSEKPGFQISGRADFIEDTIGLQTTFVRPIINTRDEPHASLAWRRLHVINGDANRFDIPNYVKLASTAAFLRALESALATKKLADEFDNLCVEDDLVETAWTVSRDLDLKHKICLKNGMKLTALQWQLAVAELVGQTLTKMEIDSKIREELDLGVKQWIDVALCLKEGLEASSSRIEWVAKLLLFDRARQRGSGSWGDVKLAALDLQWADLRPGQSIVDKLREKGLVEEIFSPEEILQAAFNGPQQGRAALRAAAVRNFESLKAASWNSLVFDFKDSQNYQRIKLPDPNQSDFQQLLQALQSGEISLVERACLQQE